MVQQLQIPATRISDIHKNNFEAQADIMGFLLWVFSRVLVKAIISACASR